MRVRARVDTTFNLPDDMSCFNRVKKAAQKAVTEAMQKCNNTGGMEITILD